MRHFPLREFGLQAIAVPGLSYRLEPACARLDPVRGSRATNRLTPPRRPALIAQALPPIATTADTKLNSTPLAAREPVLGRRQQAPCRRFLDMEREP